MIGDRIRYLRTINNMKQTELAEKVGMSVSTVRMWETNQRQPNNDCIRKIVNLFDTSPDFLYEHNEKTKTDETQIAFYNQIGKLTTAQKKEVLNFINYLRSLENE